MKFCFLALFLTVGVTVSFAQQGVFGPSTNHVEAGDLAPDLHLSKVVSAPGVVTWSPANLFGQITVIGFFATTSNIQDAVSSWNATARQLAGKGVQFVWVTDEKESSLVPFLAQHPMRGWVMLDPDHASAREYGLEVPETAIVGTDGKVLGFTAGTPESDVVRAAVDGTVSTDLKKPGEHLEARPMHLPTPSESRPPLAPSFDIHVSISPRSDADGTADSSGDDYISLKGFTLKDAIARAAALNPVRIDLPPELDTDQHYDLAMVLPRSPGGGRMRQYFLEALLDYFGVGASTELRLTDVYAVSAPHGLSPAFRVSSQEGDWGFQQFSLGWAKGKGPPSDSSRVKDFTSLTSIGGNITMDGFCRFLENLVDRPVLNETGARGEFKFDVQASNPGAPGGNDLLDRLREQTGIVIEPAQRWIQILVVGPPSITRPVI
jgi:uncharacterized protein (TIGR03435 family)